MIEHRPTQSLYSERGNFVGYLCLHCGDIYTPSGRSSSPFKSGARVNKAHATRVAAAERFLKTQKAQKRASRKSSFSGRKVEKASEAA